MNYEEAVTAYFEDAKQSPGEPRMPNAGLSEEFDGIWHLANVNGPLAVVTGTGEVIAVDEFWKTYEQLSEEGNCYSPGGAEYRRVLREWVETRPDNMEQFIEQSAGAAETELTSQHLAKQEFVEDEIHSLLCTLAGKSLERDVELIGEVRDAISSMFQERGVMTEMDFYPYL